VPRVSRAAASALRAVSVCGDRAGAAAPDRPGHVLAWDLDLA
jgi:hypothetical protein